MQGSDGKHACGRATNVSRDEASARTVEMVYQGTYSYVRIERAEPGAAPSLHPASVGPAALQALLSQIRFDRNSPLFNADELQEIVPHLVAALSRARPEHDLSFAVAGKHSALGIFVPRSVTTGRLFRTAEGLQLIVGLAQKPFESQYTATGYLIPFEPGRRAAAVDRTVSLSVASTAGTAKRADWLSLDPAIEVASPPAPAAPAAVATMPAARPAAAAAPAAPPAQPATPDADALYRSASERLKALQRLRDGGLITPQEYEEKRRQILREL